jgi:hypothetical protein
MADVKISGLPASTTPLAGTEVLPIVQSGVTKQVTIANVTAGRDVSATKFIPTGGAVTGNGVYLPATNSIALTTNGVTRTYWDAANHTLVGGVTTSRASLDYALQVETTNSLAGISAYRNQNAAGGAPAMWLGRSRGTTNGSFTAVQAADTLGSLVFSGADGTTDVVGAAITGFVGNTVSTNIVPTYLTVRTMNDAGTYAERARVHASGGVSIGNTTDPGATNLSVTGNVVMATSGKGIDFSATSDGTGTATSELFSDYEEGTWTPTLGGSTGNPTSVVYGNQVGTYTKIGRMVFVNAQITFTTYTGGTGNLYISGLPYTPTGANRGAVNLFNVTYTGFITAGTTGTNIQLFQNVSAAGYTFIPLTGAPSSATSKFVEVSIVYFV